MFDVLFYFVDSGEIKSKIFSVSKNCTIKDFVLKNNLSAILPNFNCKSYKIGVFGKIKNSDYVIKKNDRLELYNPITIDPKIRRKNIAINS
ncbi:RnfH family protein [Gammaproteobacteria bacterium]|nr:RnfH family protein [Gammaproteobacteria bacterium]